MDPKLQAAPGYYVWELPGKPVVVHLSLALIDRLSAEVMRGFGLVPKRGAEVGGLLLGTIEQGSPTIVRVEDFEQVPCDYKRGPSYLFTADDGSAFDEACTRSTSAVGYFRSHTREGMSLAPEDIEIMEQYFPSPSSVVLLIRPFATKVSIASFFFREDGLFQSAAPLEFPFRYRELTGQEAPQRRPMIERMPRRRDVEIEAAPPRVDHEPEFIDEPRRARPAPGFLPPAKTRSKGGGVWLPLSFVFLLLGVVLGYQAAVTMGAKASSAGAAGDYSLGLTVTKEGANLSVKWDREASAVKAAQKGVLEIEDGGKTKLVDLDAAQLSNGNIVFTNSTGTVHFRLILHPLPSVTVTQAVEWKQSPQKKESEVRSQ
jgi:hypothetical protein